MSSPALLAARAFGTRPGREVGGTDGLVMVGVHLDDPAPDVGREEDPRKARSGLDA